MPATVNHYNANVGVKNLSDGMLHMRPMMFQQNIIYIVVSVVSFCHILHMVTIKGIKHYQALILFKGVVKNGGSNNIVMGQLLESPLEIYIVHGTNLSSIHKGHATVSVTPMDHTTVKQFCGKHDEDYQNETLWEDVLFENE